MLSPYVQAAEASSARPSLKDLGSSSADVMQHPLFERIKSNDTERMGGTQVHYNSFSDFVTTFHEEANNPNVIGAADILDVINPLQHLPLVSQIYREMTGDTIKPGARIIGGAVFGGAAGLASSSVNAVIQEETGKDVAENVVSALAGKESFRHKPADMTILALQSEKENTPDLQIKTNSDDNSSFSYTTASETTPPVQRASPQHVVSAYQRVAETAQISSGPGLTHATPTPRYERIRMVDPERMAGSFVRYS